MASASSSGSTSVTPSVATNSRLSLGVRATLRSAGSGDRMGWGCLNAKSPRELREGGGAGWVGVKLRGAGGE
jgi:hypothetical protein